jgi:hypothetical protein
LVADGTRSAGHVDAFGRFVFVDGREGAEQEAVDVGEDGGAARRDAALLERQVEVPQLSVNVGCGFVLGEILAEEGGEVGGVVALRGGVASAKRRVHGSYEAAALAGAGVVLAAFLSHGETP